MTKAKTRGGKPPTALLIHGDCIKALELFVATGATVDSIVMDPAYQSQERHRAKGTTTRLKESSASSNKWFPIFSNENYWTLFPLLWKALINNGYLHSWADVETADVILHGRCPYNKPTHLKLHEIMQVWDGCCWETGEQSWTVWPRFPWIKTLKGVEVDPLATEVDLTYEQVRKGLGYHWARCHEEILIFEKGHRALNDAKLPGLLLGARAGKNQYPTEKPLAAYERLILNTTDENDIVLDPFAGSGNAGVAALKHGRSCVLIDVVHEGVYTTFRREGLLDKLAYQCVDDKTTPEQLQAALVTAGI